MCKRAEKRSKFFEELVKNERKKSFRLSMPHDDDSKCAEFRKTGKTQQNIMSRMLDHNTHPWSWSTCSRHFVTEFLEWVSPFGTIHKVLKIVDERVKKSTVLYGWPLYPAELFNLQISFSLSIRRNNYGFCMLDKPKKDMIEVGSRRLAGEKFSADEQCKLVFGPESRVCSYMVNDDPF